MTGPFPLHKQIIFNNFAALERFINEELYALAGILVVESNILLSR
ncbi:Lrp/AsnC ligand binding domain-containing protein [Bacillus mesophilum]